MTSPETSEAEVEAAAEVAYLRNRAGTDSWPDLPAQHKQDWREKVTPVLTAAAQVRERTPELLEWKQAAKVEAGLRREFLTRAEMAERKLVKIAAHPNTPELIRLYAAGMLDALPVGRWIMLCST